MSIFTLLSTEAKSYFWVHNSVCLLRRRRLRTMNFKRIPCSTQGFAKYILVYIARATWPIATSFSAPRAIMANLVPCSLLSLSLSLSLSRSPCRVTLLASPIIRHTGLLIIEIALLPPHLLGVLGQGWHLELTELQRLGLESRDHARYRRVRSMR